MKDRLVPAQGGSANFGDSRVTVTLGTASGGPPGVLPGVGLAGPARPDVRGWRRRRRRSGRAAAKLAFLPLSGEVPPTPARVRPLGTEFGSPDGRARA